MHDRVGLVGYTQQKRLAISYSIIQYNSTVQYRDYKGPMNNIIQKPAMVEPKQTFRLTQNASIQI